MTSAMIELDAAWLAANPLPALDGDTSKDGRGRVLVAGGAVDVPGALLLTGEAVLRVGAGKVRLATVDAAAPALGIAFPEAAVLALPTAHGEIGFGASDLLAEHVARADTVVLGPGMGSSGAAEALVRGVAAIDSEAALLLDAAAVVGAAGLAEVLAPWRGRLVLTPHCGEMAGLCDCDVDAIKADPAGIARRIAADYGAVVVLKDAETVIATPDGALLHFCGGGPGLGTGGSGDVLAGAIAGLLARGAAPLVAAGWGVWLHGGAGRRLASEVGTVGFLGRELLALLPRLLAEGAG